MSDPRRCSALNYNALSGAIPASIGSLTGLISLCARWVKVGTPSHIFCRELNVNALSGSIPESIGSLTSLPYLCADIPGAGASGQGQWVAERFACRNLANNQLHTIPESIGSMTGLTNMCVWRAPRGMSAEAEPCAAVS